MSFLCLKYVCECMTMCQCGNLFATTQEKYIGPNPRSIRKHCKPRIIVPHQLLQEKNPWQQNHDKARDASRSATKKGSTFRYGIGGSETKFIEHLNWHTIGPTTGSSTSTVSRTSTSDMMHLIGREHDTPVRSICEVWTRSNKQDHYVSVLDTKK